jgi:chromosome segregation ATPase
MLILGQNDQRAIASLRNEFEKAWKLVESSQEREAKTREVIYNLRCDIRNLTDLIEQSSQAQSDPHPFSLQSVERSVNLLTTQIADQDRQLTELQQCLDDTKQEIKDDTLAIEKSEKELEVLSSDVEKEVSLAKTITDEGDEITEASVTVADEIRAAQSFIRNQDAELERRKRALAASEKDFASHALDGRYWTEELAKTQRQIEKLGEKLEAKHSDRDHLREIIDSHAAELKEAMGNFTELTEELSGLDAAAVQGKADLERARAEFAEMEHERFAYMDQIKTFQKDAMLIKAKVFTGNTQNRMLRLSLDVLSRERTVTDQRLSDAVVTNDEAEISLSITERIFSEAKGGRKLDTKQMMKDADEIYSNIVRASKIDANLSCLMQDTAIVNQKMDAAIRQLANIRDQVSHKESVVSLLQREQELTFRTLTKMECANKKAMEELFLGKMEIDGLRKGIRELDQQSLDLHLRRETITQGVVDLTEEAGKLEHGLQVRFAENERLDNDIALKAHLVEQGKLSIAAEQRVLDAIRADCARLARDGMARRTHCRALIDEWGFLDTDRSRKNCHYEKLIDQIQALEDELDRAVDKKRELVMKVRDCVRLRKHLTGLEREMLVTQTNITVLEGEAEVPRHVHRWDMLCETNPDLWHMISMKLALIATIADQSSRSDRLSASRTALKNQIADMRKRIHKVPASGFSGQFSQVAEELREKSKQLREMEVIIMSTKPTVDDEHRQVKSVRSLIRAKRLENDDDKQKANQSRKPPDGDPTSDRLQIRPPKLSASSRAPGRFVGGGFQVGDFHPPPEVPPLNLAAIEVKKTKPRPKTSRTNAVLVPGAARKQFISNWASRPNSQRIRRD